MYFMLKKMLSYEKIKKNGVNKILFFDNDYNQTISKGIITLLIPNNSQWSYHY